MNHQIDSDTYVGARTTASVCHQVSNHNHKLQGVQEFCASILYLVVLCQFLISDARRDSFEKLRAHSRAQCGHFLDKSQK
jgi:hypothetical protein